MPSPTCEVIHNAHQAEALAHDLHKAIRRLKRSLDKCATCSQADDCSPRQQINAQISEAITAISDDWSSAPVNI
jgi:hypothetical protein